MYFVWVYTSLFSMKIKYNITAKYFTEQNNILKNILRRFYQSLCLYHPIGSSARLNFRWNIATTISGHAFRLFVGFRILSVFSVSLLRMWLRIREPCESERDLDAPLPAQGQSFRDRSLSKRVFSEPCVILLVFFD